MRSPFPGMDPYIEACHLWEDFHHDLILEIKSVLAAVLPAPAVLTLASLGLVVVVMIVSPYLLPAPYGAGITARVAEGCVWVNDEHNAQLRPATRVARAHAPPYVPGGEAPERRLRASL